MAPKNNGIMKALGYLFVNRNGVQDIAILINHPEGQAILVCREDGETRFRAAENGAVDGLDFSRKGGS